MTASQPPVRPGGQPGVAPQVAADLGAGALAQLLARMPDGVVVTDAAGRLLYANPVAGEWLGRAVTSPHGTDPLPAVLTGRSHGAAPAAGRLRRHDGEERDIISVSSAVDLGDSPHTVSAFRDLTAARTAVRRAVALVQTVGQVAGTSPTNQVLAGIARHAVEGTRALMAGFSIVGPDGKLDVGGAYGPGGPSYDGSSPAWTALNQGLGDDVIAAMTAGGTSAGGPSARVVVVSDARTTWEADPVMAAFARALSGLDWRAAICVPLLWESRVIGVFGAYFSSGAPVPTEAELAFCETLADQAAIAVRTAQLGVEAERAATLAERGRLARELHDSVSQALFSMTMHARAAELTLRRAEVDPTSSLSRSVGQLAELTRTTSAEMRALIVELSPDTAPPGQAGNRPGTAGGGERAG